MTDYCTQDDIEKYLNVDFTNNPDPALALWIDAVSAKIDRICNRDFDEHSDVIEYYDGKGKWGVLSRRGSMHQAITLRNHPVLAVDEVVNDSNTLVEGTDYEVYLETARIALIEPRYFTKKLKGIKVTYDYGYSAIPEVIKDICRWIVGESFKMQLKFAEVGISQSITLEGESISVPEIIDIPPWAQERLQPYVKWGI